MFPPRSHVDIFAIARGSDDHLTARQIAVMVMLYDTCEPRTVRSMAAELGVPKPSITRAVDKLSFIGYAQRIPDEMDRRSILVRLTPPGKKMMCGVCTTQSPA